jgi:hypothetical protein
MAGDFARLPLPAFDGRGLRPATAARVRWPGQVPFHLRSRCHGRPVARQIIQDCVKAGEKARLLQQMPMKMKLADQTTAMLPLTASGTTAALVIKAPVILAALREYFELLWERATPVNSQRSLPDADRLTPAQQQVLELMAEGLLDGAIANRIGSAPAPPAATSR